MTPSLEHNQTSSQTAWRVLDKDRDKWFSIIKRDLHSEEAEKEEADVLEQSSTTLVNYFLSALSPYPERRVASSKDLAIMKKAISSIVEAKEEEILNENEASALLEFLATKFVERRFWSLLNHVFDIRSPQHFKLRALRESFK